MNFEVVILLLFTYYIVVTNLDNKERKFTVFLSCSDDGLRHSRKIYNWLLKNHFEVVFDDENSAGSTNLLSWADYQVKQASNSVTTFFPTFFMFCGCQQTITLRND